MLTRATPVGLETPVEAAARRPFGSGHRRLVLYGVIMVATCAAYALGHALDGAGARALRMIGAGACGWGWMVARGLFNPVDRDARWPRGVLSAVVASGAGTALPVPGDAGEVIANLYVLSGSAALLLTFIEPLNGYSRGLPAAERRFRIGFVAVYAVLVAVSILGPEAADPTVEEARRLDLLRSACALIGLAAVAASIWFRGRHPLEAKTRKTTRRVATTEDEVLAARILDLVRRDDVHGDPDLRVTDLAARLGQPEYRVSQCISSVLGFDNFNRMINHHRIARARRLLTDPGRVRPILDVAFECGFASVGPFNRAFKVETGMTPRAFRAARIAAAE